MRRISGSVCQVARTAWRWLREWSGDAAYERYLRCAVMQNPSQEPLGRAEFCAEQLERRYSRPNRCC